jgi:non-specific serine/threonine protein kinase/serine/threonine-protein kinase
MTPERFQQIRNLFEQALEQPPDRRTGFLEPACGEDHELRSEVQRMLIADAQLESPIDLPAAAVWAKGSTGSLQSGRVPTGATEFNEPTETAGIVIDRYHLLQKIGEGGMGEVWLAEQKEPVRRRVAVKLVKAGMNTREVIARFESERQALALMDHPAIAKVFDAGSTPMGSPYFVMEYVAGVPITTYCDDHRLTTRERLELFVCVCEGVQHAHQKAIIHRDLKPSNILVTEVDGRVAAKIIDFGVAKALGQKLTVDTLFTRVGALVGTPEYMSPEQADSSREDTDTRTDVYSLGVIFYELLAGVPPLELRKIAFEEFLRRLRDVEPSKPSTKVSTEDEATSTEVASKRQTEPRALVKQIRGDLDSIALKALEKDRSRRYGSPSDFAADIGRYLKNEAVFAVPASVTYHMRKFARRHRGALATTGTFVLVLILAASVIIWQSVRAMRERDRADAEAAERKRDEAFMRNLQELKREGDKVTLKFKEYKELDGYSLRASGPFGINIQELTPELAATFGFPNSVHILVCLVDPTGPAAHAGVQPFDGITEINHQPVRSFNEYFAALAKSGSGSALFCINRRGQTVFVSIRPRR